MNYNRANVYSSPKRVIREIVSTSTHIKVIPPGLEDLQVDKEIKTKSDGVLVGLFSSGSTAKPKCIWNTLNKLKQNARISARMFQITPDDNILIIASPWHVAGLSWALMAEHRQAQYEMITPKIKESHTWIAAIKNFRPTMLLTVPTILRILNENYNWQVKRIGYGGDSLVPEDYRLLEGRCDTLIQAYGQTEAGGLVALHTRSPNKQPGPHEHICCGFAPEEFEVRCTGLPKKSETIYLNSPTAVYAHQYDTGDVGFRDADGRIYITGRNINKKGNCNMITATTSVAHK